VIKLSWLQMAHPEFQQAARQIWNCPMLDAKTSYAAHRIQLGIQKTEKDIRDLRIALCKKYAKVDENGKLLSDERGMVIFETPEQNQKFEEEFTEEFQKRFMELKVKKLDFEKLANIRGISPAQWEHLIPIMDNLPPEDEEPTLPPEIPEAEPAKD